MRFRDSYLPLALLAGALLPRALLAEGAPRQEPSLVQVAVVREDRDGDGVPDRLGDTVRVAGRATVGSDVLFPDRLNLFLQDASGGILVFDFEPTLSVQPGDSVEVLGEISHYQGMTQLRPLGIDVVEGPRILPPSHRLREEEAGELEGLEGLLVSARVVVLQRSENEGGRLLVVQLEDVPGTRLAVFVRATARHSSMLDKYDPGDLLEVTGMLGQYDPESPFLEGYQIYPRSPGDIRALRPPWTIARPLAVGMGLLFLLVVLWTLGLRRQVASRTRELAESETRYRVLLEKGPVPVLVVRGEEVLYGNPLAWDLLGAEAGPDSGERVSLRSYLTPESIHALLSEPVSTKATAEGDSGMGPPRQALRTLSFRDGRVLEVDVSEGPASHLGEGARQLWIQDETERRRFEESSRRLEARVREKAHLESLGVLAGGIAHDFNNLLLRILGNADLIREDLPSGSPMTPLLEEVQAASVEAARLTREMLTFAGQEDFQTRAVEMSVLVEEMASLLRTSISPDATLTVSLERAPVLGDPSKLRQVVLSLATNASEALENRPGQIRVSTGITTLGEAEVRSLRNNANLEPGPSAFLEVEDTGVGMDAETLDRIFDPFFSTKFMGRGLGLAAVVGIVEAHCGAIRVVSTPGVGTRFTVYLPLPSGSR